MHQIDLSPWLLERIQTGKAILFLGAGSAIGAKGPNNEIALTGDQLRDKLADRFLGGKQKSKRLMQVADYAKNEAGLFEVQNYIKSLFECIDPATFHLLIPLFRWQAIITTNYDLIIEKTYDRCKDKLQILAKIVRDGDNFSEKIQDSNSVPFLKLHGCISITNDENLPLILASEEYVKYLKNRKRLFQFLKDWGREHPIIFCGYEIGDPNIQHILFDLSDMGINRPPYAIVSPSLNEFDLRMYQGRRFETIITTFKEFLEIINTKIPRYKRKLSTFLKSNTSSIAKYISNTSTPSDQLLNYLGCELEHLNPSTTSKGCKPHDFYRGINDSWGPYIQELDIKRKVSDELIFDVILEDKNIPIFIALLKGYAGSGISASLRRFAWDAAKNHDAIIFWLNEGAIIRPNMIRELYNLINKRITIVIEDVLKEKDDVLKLIEFSNRNYIKINLVIGARINEWNVYCEDLAPKVVKEYEMRNLSEKEITALISKLAKHNCLGALEDKSVEERYKYFKLTADRQLLVALHEATSGKPFEETLLDEYNNITPTEAQTLYLDICTLNRLGVGVRAGLISRVSGIRFEDFKNKFFKPLDYIVRAIFNSKDRDYNYITRHSIIALIVFNKVLSSQKLRAEQIIRMLRYLNIDYISDKDAFSEIIKGRVIAELFSDKSFGEDIYKVAFETTAPNFYVAHQKAVFELNHPNGDLKKALELIKKAEEETEEDKKYIAHTKANILKEIALVAKTIIEKENFRQKAKDILLMLIKETNVPHSIHTLAELYIDEIREKLEQYNPENFNTTQSIEQRIIFDLIQKAEETIRRGLNKFPGDQFLCVTEAKLAKLLQNESKAINILEKAFAINPRSGHIAVRLSIYYASQGKDKEALSVLERCFKDNPTCREVNLEIARFLINENEELHKDKILRHLRASFTDGDTNYEAQFWCARHNFLYGDRKRANTLFNNLKLSKLSNTIRTKIRGKIVDTNGLLKKYHGTIRPVSSTYCFAICSELNCDIFLHYSQFSEDDWERIESLVSVIFNIGFNLSGIVGFNAQIDSIIM